MRRINRFETPLPTSEAVRKYLTRNQDGYFGRRLHGRFRELGLIEVEAEGRSVMFTRRNGGADLMRVNFEQIGADVIAAGLITRQQIDADLATHRARRLRDSVADDVERGRAGSPPNGLTSAPQRRDQPRGADARQRPAGPRRLAPQRQPDDAA